MKSCIVCKKKLKDPDYLLSRCHSVAFKQGIYLMTLKFNYPGICASCQDRALHAAAGSLWQSN